MFRKNVRGGLKMIYYLLHEKEKIELESIISREIREAHELIGTIDSSNWVKRRALQERINVLFSIRKKFEN